METIFKSFKNTHHFLGTKSGEYFQKTGIWYPFSMENEFLQQISEKKMVSK